MSAYKCKDGRCRETIIQTAKSTPILEMFMLRNIVSSTSNCKLTILFSFCIGAKLLSYVQFLYSPSIFYYSTISVIVNIIASKKRQKSQLLGVFVAFTVLMLVLPVSLIPLPHFQ